MCILQSVCLSQTFSKAYFFLIIKKKKYLREAIFKVYSFYSYLVCFVCMFGDLTMVRGLAGLPADKPFTDTRFVPNVRWGRDLGLAAENTSLLVISAKIPSSYSTLTL